MSKGKLIKRILLGLFFVVGTAVIALAILLVKNIFFAESISTRELTENYGDYMAVYNEYPAMRDLPQGFEIVDSCVQLRDNVFNYSLKVKNTGTAHAEYALQIYYSEEFMALKPKARNPFIREYSDDGLMILTDEVKEFSITGTLSKDMSAAEFKEAIKYVWLEVIYQGEAGRILLPVRFIDE